MQLVDGTFEEDLQSAILLSKLDYEEKKEIYEKKGNEKPIKEKPKESNKKIKKKKTMSIEQFNNIGKEEIPEIEKIEPINNKIEQDFFDRLNCEAKEEVEREQSKQILKSREPYNDAVTIAQFQAELEKQRVETMELRENLDQARAEIITVKTRNKKLCSLLGNCESKLILLVTMAIRSKNFQAELLMSSYTSDAGKQYSSYNLLYC